MTTPLLQEQQTTKQQQLDDALLALRRTFAKCRGRADWGDMTDSSITIKHPVWDLSEAEFCDFGWHSVTLGPPSELPAAIRYFVPRVAAKLADPAIKQSCLPAVWDDEHFAKLLNTAQWRTWKAPEVAAIEGWMFARIEHEVHGGNFYHCEEATRLATLSGCNMADFFDGCRDKLPLTAALWLAGMIEHHWESLLSTGWPSLWEECWGVPTPNEVVEPLVRLLLQQSSREWLNNIFFNQALPEDQQQRVSQASQYATYCVDSAYQWPDAPLGVMARQSTSAE